MGLTYFQWHATFNGGLAQDFRDRLEPSLLDEGFAPTSIPDESRLIFQLVNEATRPFRRKHLAVYVIGVQFLPKLSTPENLLGDSYPYLIRSLSNLLLTVVGPLDRQRIFVTTLERGTYEVLPEPNAADKVLSLYRQVTRRIAPLAQAHLIVKNRFLPNLSRNLWAGNQVTSAISEAGRVLDSWNLLPAPFPMEQMLSADDFRHVKRMFGIGGLSYGNLSARHDEETFWMSASGVNKSRLNDIGRDILLVTDYDRHDPGMILSVPESVKPRRVSVDAIEHWMIYRSHPDVGAIIHVHAWMNDVPSTDINYPCGTVELAQAVSEQIDQAKDPSRTVVGLKNHGLTITGRSIEDILDRIDGHIIRQVPMS